MSGRVVLGRYRVVAPLARGGMGIVYLGRLEGAAGFSKPVVIKTVIPDAKDARAAQLFAREARIVSNLQHPGIVGVLDFGEVDGEYIMVLEYVHGFHLGSWWRFVQGARGSMPVAHAVEVLLPVLDALEFAHRLKRADGTPLDIVHRDISPANILLDLQGNVKLHDFGIARMADDEFKTQDGTFRGTLSFTAPETLQGVPASPRSDLYACGVVLYQLLTGVNPFRGEMPSETLHRVMSHVPPRLRSVREEASAPLEEAVARALEKEPAARFESAGAFAAALRAARTWSEAETTAEMASAIERDFSSPEMSAFLGVDSLRSRDAAWRAAQSAASSLPLASSRPPGAAREQITETGEVAAAPAGPSLTAPVGPAASQPAVATVPVAPPSATKSTPLIVFAAGGLVLAMGGVSYAWLARAPAPPKERFLLIEKQIEPEAPGSVGPSWSGAALQPPPDVPAAAPSSSATPPAAKLAARPVLDASGNSITAAFQRQRGRVEACFRAEPAAAAAQPQLTIRFQIEASGAVRSADLVPASLAGSALGSCILGVARGTRFPAGDAPVSFTIPITARKTAG